MLNNSTTPTHSSNSYEPITGKLEPHAEILTIKYGSVLRFSDYRHYTVYLISGVSELHRYNRVPQQLKKSTAWENDDIVFKTTEITQYARCITTCQFLIVSSRSIDTYLSNQVIENRFVSAFDESKDASNITKTKITVKKQVDLPNRNNLIRLEKKYHVAKNSNKNMISLLTLRDSSIKDINLELEKISEEFKDYRKQYSILKNKYNRLQRINDINSIQHSISGSYKKFEMYFNASVEQLVKHKVPSIINSLSTFIQNNMKKMTLPAIDKKSGTSLQFNSNNSTSRWLNFNSAYPYQSGLYYVSDGKRVKVRYFNKSNIIFHIKNSPKLCYWSTKNVVLPQ